MHKHRAISRLPVFSHGFRIFFFSGAVWAALSMGLWLLAISGAIALPTRFDPVSWHAHEFLYGYLFAILSGFLLTAVPNWTGRPPLSGWPLIGLFLLWLLGRLAVTAAGDLPPMAVFIADSALVLALAAVLTYEIVSSRNWRNLIIVVLLGVFAMGNALFHWEAAHGIFAARGTGLRTGLAAALMMIAVIGGRIVPAFTRNWLGGQRAGRLPVPPMQPYDKAALAALALALAGWVMAPDARATGILLLIAAAAHLIRLARWAGERTLSEPLVWVLHVGYAFLPLGALLMAVEIGIAEIRQPGGLGLATAQHLWMAGAIGLMTLAVMSRATLGHSGRPLRADAGTCGLYVLLLIAVGARLMAGIWPAQAQMIHTVAGISWIASFLGFAVLYAPAPLRAKQHD
ncbi:NnrS family protein [Yunchengibacter salinarum]|uniref:NnrS family protein n=1 Tax=Yunchengibacter salinarum TaxID=3133399 RepID=UPI0035B6430C